MEQLSHQAPGTVECTAGDDRRSSVTLNKMSVDSMCTLKSKTSIPHLSFFSSHLNYEEADSLSVRGGSMVRLPQTNEQPHVREVKDLSKFRFYAVNMRKFLVSAQELYDCVLKYLVQEDFWVKRIRKSHGKLYLRLGIGKRVGEAQKDLVLQKISSELDVNLKELNMVVNHSVKNKDVDSESSRNLTVLTLNINRMNGRKEELAVLLSRLKPDIICLQETHVGSSEKKTYIPGYITFEVPEGNDGLGLLVGYRKKSDLTIAVKKTDPNFVCFYAFVKGAKVMICNVYRSLTRPGILKKVDKQVVELAEQCEQNCPFIAVGDWNCQPDKTLRRFANGKAFVEASFAPTKGTRIMHGRRSKRAIDYGIGNSELKIKDQSVKKKWCISDHLPVVVTLDIPVKDKEPKMRVIFDRTRLALPKLAKIIREYKFKSLKTCDEDPASFFTELKNLLCDLKISRNETLCYKNTVPNLEIKKAVLAKQKAYRLARKGYVSSQVLVDAKKNLRRVIREQRKRMYSRYIQKGISFLKRNDARNSWKWIKTHCNLSGKSSTTGNIYIPGTKRIETNLEKQVQHWATHFERLSEAPKPGSYKTSNFVYNNSHGSSTDRPITWSEISVALKMSRKNKACGVDGIPTEVYKLVEDSPNSDLAKGLAVILNQSFNGNKTPDQWSESIVVPILKKGDRSDPNNYRGISLICTASKILNKVLATRLMMVCEEKSLIAREQTGFMRTEECLGQAACLLEACQRRKIREDPTLLLFLDLKKAYDMVPHDELVNRLYKLGLGRTMISYIKELYKNTSIRVRINDRISQTVSYMRGVRQGCPMSPILFNIYINSILTDIEPVKVEGLPPGLKGLMYADDTVIVGDSVNDIKYKLGKVQTWLANSGMELNPSKCGLMIVEKSLLDLENPRIGVGNEDIPVVDRYEYLGINFNKNLGLDIMAFHRVTKGRGLVEKLKYIWQNVHIPLEYKRMLMTSVILPTMSYGSELYGMNISRVKIQKQVLDKALSYLLKKANFCRQRVYEEFDIKPVEITAACARIRAYLKWKNSRGYIAELIDSSDMFVSRKRTWAKQTMIWIKSRKIVLEETIGGTLADFVRTRQNQLKILRSSKIGNFAEKIGFSSGKLLRRSEWKIGNQSKGIYLITLIRTGCFRFTKQLILSGILPDEFRHKCIGCQKNILEDEYHFLVECEGYSDLRKGRIFERIATYISSSSQNDEEKWCIIKQLLEGEKDVLDRERFLDICALAKYLVLTFERRLGFIKNLNIDQTLLDI